MKNIKTLLGVFASTFLLVNAVNANTIEVVKAAPIDHDEVHAAVKLQLQDTLAQSIATISSKDLLIETLLVSKSQQAKNKSIIIANIDYSAE